MCTVDCVEYIKIRPVMPFLFRKDVNFIQAFKSPFSTEFLIQVWYFTFYKSFNSQLSIYICISYFDLTLLTDIIVDNDRE